jgi:ribosomal protein S27AE
MAANAEGNRFSELGCEGAKISNGFVHDEFLPQLVGERGRRVYRQMRDNDATVSAVLFAVEMLLRAVQWTVGCDCDEGDPRGEEAREFLEGVMEDMSHTWDDFIGNALTMLQYGWQYTEVVLKRRVGPDERDPSKRSKFTDGRIGVRKLADRSQETLDRWEIDEDGGVLGMHQMPPNGGALRYVPIERALLFRPHVHKGSPEGRSVLRGAYRSWYLLKNVQEVEAIAIERELNGLPVVYVPDAIINGATDGQRASLEKYKKLVRDIKLNHQGGAVLPSDPWYDADGNPTALRQVELTLLSTNGRRAVDTDKTVKRYQTDIARTILADFIMLGQSERGGWALSRSKTDFFARALEGWLESIAAVLNRHLVPKLWRINGFDRDVTPYFVPGNVAPEDLEELGSFVERLSRAGFTLAPDDDLENRLRDAAGLPERAPDDGALPGDRPAQDEPPPAPADDDLEPATKNADATAAQTAARNALNNAIIAGKISRPKLCSDCGKQRPLQAHHKDYSRPLDVRWLCQSCHMHADRGTERGGAR